VAKAIRFMSFGVRQHVAALVPARHVASGEKAQSCLRTPNNTSKIAGMGFAFSGDVQGYSGTYARVTSLGWGN
jgi:hypothetical protein